ncbi:MAG: hypothetical protein P8N02_09430 [Actinomycetota bacterium]|nr:hypothetical protein [Actinomycetota bacterium]
MPLDEFVIDIVRGDLLIEIQTGSIGAMGRKLDRLLEHHHIRVVHPMAAVRWLEQPGKKRRRSPTKRGMWNLFDELVSIPTLLDHPRLELHIVLVEETEERSGTDMVRRGRRGRVVDRRLDSVVDERLFTSADELLEVVPDDLANPFTTAELATAAKIRRDLAQRACYVLRHTGLISEVDRTKAGYRYRR